MRLDFFFSGWSLKINIVNNKNIYIYMYVYIWNVIREHIWDGDYAINRAIIMQTVTQGQLQSR